MQRFDHLLKTADRPLPGASMDLKAGDSAEYRQDQSQQEGRGEGVCGEGEEDVIEE